MDKRGMVVERIGPKAWRVTWDQMTVYGESKKAAIEAMRAAIDNLCALANQ